MASYRRDWGHALRTRTLGTTINEPVMCSLGI